MIAKKGILMPTTLEMVIAAACIFLLVAGAYMVLTTVSSNQETAAAKNFINGLMSKIQTLDNGQSNSFLIRGIQDWYLVGWSLNDPAAPQKCLLSSCVCVCPKPNAVSCQSKQGVCKETSQATVRVGTDSFTLQEHFKGDSKGTFEGADLTATYSPTCIPLKGNFLSVFVVREKDRLDIRYQKLDSDSLSLFTEDGCGAPVRTAT